MLIQKPTREIRSWSTDSRRWSAYRPRPDDIVIATSAKCGTTWMQQIVSLLIFQSAEPRMLQGVTPWIDHRVMPIEPVIAALDAQTHRRFIKAHLPLDAIPFYGEVRYIHVARDGRDAFLSWHNHSANYRPELLTAMSAVGEADEAIARPYPPVPADVRAHFARWMTEGREGLLADDFPATRYFEIERSYWAARKRENLLMVHYADLKADLAGEMRRIASFLGIQVPETLWPGLVEAASFDFMRRNGAALMPRAAMAWDKGHERFFNKGTNARWREELSAEDVSRYEERVRRECPPGLARWLESGRLAAGDPRGLAD